MPCRKHKTKGKRKKVIRKGETVLSHEVGTSTPKGWEKASQTPEIEYVCVFLCPDGVAIQYPAPSPTQKKRRWKKVGENVLKFIFRVVT